MTDFWTLLLQTLTASGAAVLLLALKALFRDKLSPRWQFRAWGILGLVLLCPAGLGGRWALFPWARWIEAARSALTGEYGTLAQVTAPIPLPSLTPPHSPADWLYALYTAGVLFFLLRYAWNYLRLRRALPQAQENAAVQAAAARFGLPSCPATEIPGLSSAFVCGVFRPVMALPAEQVPDEKILLHELMHLNHHDILWGMVICFFRCLHWCNPLLHLCCHLARNDLEALCDQRVLERLEGEARRDYGRILLSMADDKQHRFPGTSAIANGPRNIRRRIESIVRFKKYPAGMGLVSVCILLAVSVPLVMGHPGSVPDFSAQRPAAWNLACARTTYCTTMDGAFDTYAKAVLAESRQDYPKELAYRAMCAPLEEQDRLAAHWPDPQSGVPASYSLLSFPYALQEDAGYCLYNITPAEDGGCQALLVLPLLESPRGDSVLGWYAYQHLRAEREGARWVVRPLEAFWLAYGSPDHITWEREEIQVIHEIRIQDFTVQLWVQNRGYMERVLSGGSFWDPEPPDLVPEPNGHFSDLPHLKNSGIRWIFTGPPEQKPHSLGYALAPFPPGAARPVLDPPGRPDISGAGSDGSCWASIRVPEDTGHAPLRDYARIEETQRYALDLYVNGQLQEQLTLPPAKK